MTPFENASIVCEVNNKIWKLYEIQLLWINCGIPPLICTVSLFVKWATIFLQSPSVVRQDGNVFSRVCQFVHVGGGGRGGGGVFESLSHNALMAAGQGRLAGRVAGAPFTGILEDRLDSTAVQFLISFACVSNRKGPRIPLDLVIHCECVMVITAVIGGGGTGGFQFFMQSPNPPKT